MGDGEPGGGGVYIARRRWGAPVAALRWEWEWERRGEEEDGRGCVCVCVCGGEVVLWPLDFDPVVEGLSCSLIEDLR